MSIIGEGGQGTVHIGYNLDQENNPVAIKKCKGFDENSRTEFTQELLILSRVNHANIVKLLGCCLQFEVPVLVYEFVPNKTLHNLLHIQNDPSTRPLWIRLKVAADSAEALAYLHLLDHPILHGDVKSANILLSTNFIAKISDFGCSKIRAVNENDNMVKGTIGYLDPEYLLKFELTDKSDVYSFGVVLLELLTRRKPLSKDKVSLTSVFQEAMTEGYFLELIDKEIMHEDNMGLIRELAVLACQCLVMAGESRPAMSRVAEELRRLERLVQHHHGELPDVSSFTLPASLATDTSEYFTGEENTGRYSTIMSIEFARSSYYVSREDTRNDRMQQGRAATSDGRGERADYLCAFSDDFKIDCNNSKPTIFGTEVLNISLSLGQIRVMNQISSSCYNTTSARMDSSTEWQFNLTGTPFMLSDSNKLTVIGCRTLAYIADDYYVGNYLSGCVSACRRGEVKSATNGTCSGIGCCQTPIPKGLDYYLIWFDVNTMNTSGIYNRTPCSYAVLMDASNFTFSTTYLTSPMEFNNSYGGQAPVVLDWAIRAHNSCVEAQKDPKFMCKSEHSSCVNSSNGPGYICNCTEGYRGNPYLQGPNGCQGASACVLAAIFGFLGWEVIRNKRHIKKQALLRQNDEFFQQHGGELLLEMMRVEGNVGFTIYDRDEIEATTDNFSKTNIIGEGGQGTVYRAVLDGVVVAIKMCKEINESRRKDFVQELVILCRVSHPNVVKLLGCCLQFEAPMLVYEFVRNKTLQELLDLQRSRRFHATLGTRLRIAVESAFALAHIHSLPHPILHGDVKPANILLAEGLVVKVSDFGCSTIDEKAQAMPKGTPGYLDPDYLLEYQLTAKNDVYSFGVILLELLTGKRPLSKERKSLTSMFQEAMADGTLLELLDNDIVNEASMGVIHQAAVLASQCLIVPGSTRPTMRRVAEELRRLAEADELQQYLQQPLVIENHSFMEMEIGNTCTTSWYAGSSTTGVYSLENKAVHSTEFAR
ncbi:hypothetical protein GUJ93_ZPchr0004g40374 [Zizania palustris]|uniref:Protein kinase domain-containing protein n=1 Tax=Zizania palustris TaxID=103762 RepID=A0A8J5RZR5_ZIZPA|nr:hypothetical protein GUJ93_ZPchr0004g40374 [Zizania palustris]